MAKIKVCGLMTEQDAVLLNENQIHYGGMVLFFPKSKRNITIEQAKKIIRKLNKEILKVAVVVSPTMEQTKQIEEAGFDIIQIHGAMEEGVLESIHIPVWKAFNVKDLAHYEKYARNEKIKGYVFDAATPGSGQVFDWNSMKEIPRDGKLWILAGGLKKENVKEAIQCVSPDVVDVSSGVECDDKKGKDADKIKEFANEVRR